MRRKKGKKKGYCRRYLTELLDLEDFDWMLGEDVAAG